MSATEQPTRRAINLGALPTDTAIRFVLLLLSVSTASLYLFQSMWFALRGQQFGDAIERCNIAQGQTTQLLGSLTAEMDRETSCLAGVSREQSLFAVSGVVVMMALAWVIYRLRPSWRERRARLVSLEPASAAALLSDVADLAKSSGVDPVPDVRVDAANPGVQAYAYGAGRDLRIGMTGGLVVQSVLDRPAFTAIVRHELGHVANRDVPWTYFTVSVWWAFLGIAVTPVVVVFALSDPTYILRLGWRTAALALLVAVVGSGLLRTRERYADARAAEWGSRDDLDRILEGQPAPHGWRPNWLRTHPAPTERRQLLADSDGLFGASAVVALTTGIAAGTAFASLHDIGFLVMPNIWSILLSALAVAVPVSVVVCVLAWRVGLREGVRGVRRPLGLTLGIWLGIGLAVAPVLTIQSARGGLATGASGWEGYAVWALAMIVGTVLVVRWVADSARMRVGSLFGVGSPRRALIVHIALASFVFAFLLSLGSIVLALLTSQTISSVVSLWLDLPLSLGGGWVKRLPLLILIGVIAFGLVSRWDFLRTWGPAKVEASTRRWFWSDPEADDLSRVGGRPANPPSLLSLAIVGLAAAGAVTLVLVATRLLGGTRDIAVRSSTDFVLAIGDGQTGAIVVAAVAASVGGAMVSRARWWPLGLVAGAVGLVGAGTVGVAVNVAAGCGVLPALNRDCSLPTTGLVSFSTLDPATRAAMPAFLAVASVGVARAAWTATRPTTNQASTRTWGSYGVLVASGLVIFAALGGAAVAAIDVMRVQPVVVAGPGYTVTPPTVWDAHAVGGSDAPVFVLDTQDVTIIIAPQDSEFPPESDARLVVGGLEAWPLQTQTAGLEELRLFEVSAPAGLFVIAIRGTSANIERRANEITNLLDSVQWTET